MSWRAVNWANEQRTGRSSTKHVLLLLANWADEDGFVKQVVAARIAESAEQSERSVYRRLLDLEEMGLLTREQTGNKPGGAPLIVGRLHLDRKVAIARRRSEDDGSAEGASEARDCQIDSGGDCQIGSASPGGTATAGSEAVPTLSVAPYYVNLDKIPPQAPPAPARPDREAADKAYDRLVRAYAWRGWMNGKASRAAFDELHPRQWDPAISGAAAYAAAIEADKRRSVTPLAEWLQTREFEAAAEIARARATREGFSRPHAFVAEGGRYWEEWRERTLALGGAWPPVMTTAAAGPGVPPELAGRRGAMFPTLRPPRPVAVEQAPAEVDADKRRRLAEMLRAAATGPPRGEG